MSNYIIDLQDGRTITIVDGKYRLLWPTLEINDAIFESEAIDMIKRANLWAKYRHLFRMHGFHN